jgi:hypothetical protein
MRAIKLFKHTVLTAALAAAGLAGSVGNASAYVACNRFGDCWHTDARVHFPGMRLIFHPDSWWDRHKNNHHYGRAVDRMKADHECRVQPVGDQESNREAQLLLLVNQSRVASRRRSSTPRP